MLLLICLSLLHRAFALTVSIPSSPGAKAPFISPSLISFSIEQDRWPEWVGTDARNEFFFNTLNNLKTLTGAAPSIRIGANTGDLTNFRADAKTVEAVFPPPSDEVPFPEAEQVTVGNDFYTFARHLPAGTHVTWQVNLGQLNMTTAVLEAKAMVDAFDSAALQTAGVVLEYIEVGNEPDLYILHGLRDSSYNSATYLPEWTTFASNVSRAVDMSTRTTKFLLGSVTNTGLSPGFTAEDLYNGNVLSSSPGALVAAFSQHHYSGAICTGDGGLLQGLMNKTTIRTNLTILMDDIIATHARGLDYILGETNNYAGPCHGSSGVSSAAGAALWALDHALFASQVGISKAFFHGGVGHKYNLIQPVALDRSITDGSVLSSPVPAHVQPAYYAAIIAAELRGSADKVQISELVVNHPRISGYAAYEGSKLVRVLFINSQAFLQGNVNRTSVHLDLSLTPGGQGPTIIIKRLAIEHADDTSGLTWGGQTYETQSGRAEGKLRLETKTFASGVDIAETEVVLLQFS
ncbi:glycoside hydrolase family 79 protein [Mycena crocata]|nr:glycoside hydrolase family 79 protein [Mycena crocata]